MNLELQKRVKTAGVGAAILLGALLLLGDLGAVIVAVTISVACLYEFSQIVFQLEDRKDKTLVLCGSAALMLMLIQFSIQEYTLLIIFFLGLMSYFLFTSSEHTDENLKTHYQEMMYSVFGFIYLGFLPSYLINLRVSAHGLKWVMLFLLICWVNDSGAYFAGLKYGRRRLFERISPKKSWEGALGGAGASLVLSILFKVLIFRQLSWLGALLIPIMISVASPVGDLAESFLKRSFDKKDSGSLLPGHGGFLDRFDGVIFSLPVMYALTRIFGAL